MRQKYILILPNKHSGITDTMATYALDHEDFPFRLQQVSRLATSISSIRDGSISANEGTLSDDDTCIHSQSSPYGHKVYKGVENGVFHCSCKRHFSDPDAHWGWNSNKEMFYFGYTLYMLYSHNAEVGVALFYPCISVFCIPRDMTASEPLSLSKSLRQGIPTSLSEL